MICRRARMMAFPSPAEGKAFFDSLPALTVSNSFECVFCDGWHFEADCREPSGASSGTGTRPLTLKIPQSVKRNLVKLNACHTNEQIQKTEADRRARERNSTQIFQG